MPSLLIPEHVDLLGNPNPVLKWLEDQDLESQQRCEFAGKLPQRFYVALLSLYVVMPKASSIPFWEKPPSPDLSQVTPV
ncbi:hypothetical protein TGAMA5MH_01514 [Trichoderma gamsii]|uniref:Uncharacterized protein n=1 Tax=Trichoderma gamsii TaxID=398673 RepID=A0A2K0TQ94_9HYPO|nr:hypothetical protein TGAMA5MH_01514 [Trichoderma gamsii]